MGVFGVGQISGKTRFTSRTLCKGRKYKPWVYSAEKPIRVTRCQRTVGVVGGQKVTSHGPCLKAHCHSCRRFLVRLPASKAEKDESEMSKLLEWKFKVTSVNLTRPKVPSLGVPQKGA
ncbi:hypothetical protein NDU88_004460 [Pleurodeles waltl]|uniref:Uncharacterized protein n=1 Tax=Pleurodeles waltl TaxID=8319 RepID=A0AAV7TRB2_PLEWA|nr:hypothetical protein NDU88_004460 [Pleurodeles waltl]